MTNKNTVSVRLKLPLTAEAKSTMENFLSRARQANDAEEKQEAERTKLHKRASDLRVEVDALQAQFDQGNLEVLEKLTSKKAQHALIAARESEPLRASGRDPWHDIMASAHEFLRPYLITGLEDLREEIIEAVLPFCTRPGEAEQVARNLTIIGVYQNWFNHCLLSLRNPRSAVAQLVRVMESMLAGEEFWTYEPSH